MSDQGHRPGLSGTMESVWRESLSRLVSLACGSQITPGSPPWGSAPPEGGVSRVNTLARLECLVRRIKYHIWTQGGTKHLHFLSRCILSWLPLAGLPCWGRSLSEQEFFSRNIPWPSPTPSSWELGSSKRAAGTFRSERPLWSPESVIYGSPAGTGVTLMLPCSSSAGNRDPQGSTCQNKAAPRPEPRAVDSEATFL